MIQTMRMRRALRITGAFAAMLLAASAHTSESVNTKQRAAASVSPSGKAVYDRWCASCHAADYKKHPGTLALQAKYSGKLPADLEKRTDLNKTTVKYFVRHGVSMMPPFRKTEITDLELEALAQHLTSRK